MQPEVETTFLIYLLSLFENMSFCFCMPRKTLMVRAIT